MINKEILDIDVIADKKKKKKSRENNLDDKFDWRLISYGMII